jgi:GAF domain-containing protein
MLNNENSTENNLNNAKNKILGMLDEYSLKEISDVVFEEVKALTKSRNCYVAFVDPENKDSVGISFSHLTKGCQYYADLGEARFKIRKDGTYGGLLGYSLDTGESFFTHDPKNHPAAHGLPPGHEPVSQFLSVAVKNEDKILGQIVAANPEENYSHNHLKIAEEIANVYSTVLKQYYLGKINIR